MIIQTPMISLVVLALTLGQSGLASAKGGERPDHDHPKHYSENSTSRKGNPDQRIDQSHHRYTDQTSRGSSRRAERKFIRRQINQRARILEGRESGSLTRREMIRLRQDQKKIRRMVRRFSQDGYLTPREQHKLNKAQDRASRRIARAKHNDRVRGNHPSRNDGSGHEFGYSHWKLYWKHWHHS
ncbi:MAG: hypothetical protein GY703_01855 [Gammaproteobacteria bacterium]|nr:hypothetical protein [Gammaproteobacteria bacterium]